MSTFSSVTARVFFLIAVLIGISTIANAMQIGPRLTWDKHGPGIGGYKPLERPIPDKPLDGVKVSVNDLGKGLERFGKAIGPVIARPFEQFFQSLKDPWGWKKKAQEFYDGAMTFANKALLAAIDAFNRFTSLFCLTIGFGFGVLSLAIARRRSPAKTPPPLARPLINPLHA